MSKPTVIIDIGNRYIRVDGRRLSTVEDISSLKGDKWVVSDLEEAIPRVLAVDSPLEYSEAVIEKRLRNIGELQGPGRVLSHRGRKLGSNSSETFFTAIPVELYDSFASAEMADDSHRLLFAFNALLSCAVDKASPNRPMAALIEHGRHVSFIVADRHAVYGAERISAPAEGADRASIVENLSHALRSIEQSGHIKIGDIHYYQWLSFEKKPTAWLDTVATDLKATLRISPDENVEVDGRRATSSLLGLIGSLATAMSSSSAEAKNRYRAQEAMPLTAALLVGLCGVAFLAGLFFQGKTLVANSKISSIRAAVAKGAQERHELEQAIAKDKDREMVASALTGPIAMAGTLRIAGAAPSFTQIISEVSSASKGQVGFDRFSITFPENRIALSLEGRITSAAHYNTFVAGLTKTGYKIKGSQLDSRGDSLVLSLELEREIREK